MNSLVIHSTTERTPNLDRLAKSGVAFTRAYTAYALCNPSRTALLTGLRPSTTGVINNGIDWREAVPAERPSLPGYLRANGYRTAGQGKIFHGSKLRREDWDESWQISSDQIRSDYWTKNKAHEEKEEKIIKRRRGKVNTSTCDPKKLIGSSVDSNFWARTLALNEFSTIGKSELNDDHISQQEWNNIR